MTQPPKEITFHYLKSPAFHGVHADGVFGGATPQGDIHLSFFTERLPIPKEVICLIDEEGDVVEKSREGRQGIVRELQVDVTMRIENAEVVAKFLLEQIGRVKKLTTQQQEAKP